MLAYASMTKCALHELLEDVLARNEVVDTADDGDGGNDAHDDCREYVPDVTQAGDERTHGFNRSEEDCHDADSLEGRLPLAALACRHDKPLAGGERAESLHAGFTEVDERHHPHGRIVRGDEAHENRHVRNLVAERVEVLAKRAHFAHGAGEFPVQKVGKHEPENHRERKHLEYDAVVAVVQVVVVEEYPEEERREHDTAHRKLACNGERLAVCRVAVVPIGVGDCGGYNQQDGRHHANLLIVLEVQQVDAHRNRGRKVCKLGPTAFLRQFLAFAQHTERKQGMRDESPENKGAADAEEFFCAFGIVEVAHENACHDAELQQTVDNVQPEPVVGLLDFLATQLVEVHPPHDEGDKHEGAGGLRHAEPDEDDDADKNERP